MGLTLSCTHPTSTSTDVRVGRVALALEAKERGVLAGLLAEGEEWRWVLEQACPQALAAVEKGKWKK